MRVDVSSRATALVGERVRGRRKALGLSVRVAARLAGLDSSHWQRIEAGSVSPTVTTLVRVAVALEVDVAELVRGLAAS